MAKKGIVGKVAVGAALAAGAALVAKLAYDWYNGVGLFDDSDYDGFDEDDDDYDDFDDDFTDEDFGGFGSKSPWGFGEKPNSDSDEEEPGEDDLLKDTDGLVEEDLEEEEEDGLFDEKVNLEEALNDTQVSGGVEDLGDEYAATSED